VATAVKAAAPVEATAVVTVAAQAVVMVAATVDAAAAQAVVTAEAMVVAPAAETAAVTEEVRVVAMEEAPAAETVAATAAVPAVVMVVATGAVMVAVPAEAATAAWSCRAGKIRLRRCRACRRGRGDIRTDPLRLASPARRLKGSSCRRFARARRVCRRPL
jgi:hypothetical protein